MALPMADASATSEPMTVFCDFLRRRTNCAHKSVWKEWQPGHIYASRKAHAIVIRTGVGCAQIHRTVSLDEGHGRRRIEEIGRPERMEVITPLHEPWS